MTPPPDLTTRMAILESQQANIDTRLREGAETFATFRDSLRTLTARVEPRAVTPSRIAAAAFALVVSLGIPIASWIWQAARYPDRSEFNGIRSSVTEMQAAQTQLKADLYIHADSFKRADDRQQAIEKKLDRVLEGRRPR